jgi:YtkA-like protein
MREIYLIVVIPFFIAALALGCSKGYESQKTVDDLTISLSATRPLVKGDNALHVKVSDAAGKAVPGAQVSVRFSMPPMPGMAPMELNTQGALEGHLYTFSVNIPVEGGWMAEVSVTRPGRPAAKATFNLDVR